MTVRRSCPHRMGPTTNHATGSHAIVLRTKCTAHFSFLNPEFGFVQLVSVSDSSSLPPVSKGTTSTRPCARALRRA